MTFTTKLRTVVSSSFIRSVTELSVRILQHILPIVNRGNFFRNFVVNFQENVNKIIVLENSNYKTRNSNPFMSSLQCYRTAISYNFSVHFYDCKTRYFFEFFITFFNKFIALSDSHYKTKNCNPL